MKKIAYRIPPKIDAGGGFFGGRVRLRNMIEGVILWFATYYLVRLLLAFLPGNVRLAIAFLLALAAGLIAIRGLNGLSLTEFLLLYIKFRKEEAVYTLEPPEVVKEGKKNAKSKK